MNTFSQSGPQLDDLRQNVVGCMCRTRITSLPGWWPISGYAGSRFCLNTTTIIEAARFRRRPFTRARLARSMRMRLRDAVRTETLESRILSPTERLADFSPRLGLVYDPTGTVKRHSGAGVALLLRQPVGAFIPYRMVAQNPPYGPQVTETSGPYQFSNPWGNVPGGNEFPLPPLSKNVASRWRMRRCFCLRTPYSERVATECQRAAPVRLQLDFLRFCTWATTPPTC